MKEHFLTYEQSLALKELGFNKPCLASYETAFSKNNMDFQIGYIIDGSKNYVLAPTFSQAFKWLRDNHNLIGLIEGGYDNNKNIFTYVIWDEFRDNITDEYFNTYEEAEHALINKIIELLKLK